MAHLPFILQRPFAIAPDNKYYQDAMTQTLKNAANAPMGVKSSRECLHLVGEPSQRGLWCGCGRSLRKRGRLCGACYSRRSRNRVHFGGLREVVSERDGNSCRACGHIGVRSRSLPVHHRRPGKSSARQLITLCPSCHATVHKLLILRRSLPPLLRTLWREQHPGAPEQLSLEFDQRSTFQQTAGLQEIGVLFG